MGLCNPDGLKPEDLKREIKTEMETNCCWKVRLGMSPASV